MGRGSLAIAIIATLASGHLFATEPTARTAASSRGATDGIPMQWLDREISVEQAESENLVDRVPFGARHEDWERLKAAMLPSDRIWTFCSSFESLQYHAGRCGVALVRNGKVMTYLVTLMN